MVVEIGDKPLKEMTANQVKEIVIIEGCCCFREYWGDPQVVEFDNKMFSDTHVLDFNQLRKDDNLQSGMFTFFLDFKKLRFHYSREGKKYHNNGNRLGIESIAFLIKEGFNIKIY